MTNHEDGLVTGLFRDGAGDVVLEVTSGARQTIVLDESGAPDHIAPGGATTSRWRIPGSAVAEPEVLHRIETLFTEKVPVRMVSSGVVVLTGPVMGTWRLESEDGLVLTSQG